MTADSPALEFLVIGTQKGGTTTLWKLLRDHPQLWLPDAKEAPFFSHTEVYEEGLASYMRRLNAPSQEGVLRGTVTPHYMQGWQDASTATVAERIARTLPDVRLVALLRDPVARARSQHAMMVARGRERRGADRAMSESLRAEDLRRGRSTPEDTNTYVVQGEYGRVLGEYLSFLPRSALHVELTEDLSRDPLGVLRRVLHFIGVREDHEPVAPFERSFVGGREPRVEDADLVALLRALDGARVVAGPGRAGALAQRAAAQAWAAEHRLDAAGLEEFEQIMDRYLATPPERWRRERVGLEFTLRKIWNVLPSAPEPISDRVRSALWEHFGEDAPALAAATGVQAPWGAPG
ncbi:MAG TPA: sulfotransferase domain-containing protein [Solirubrobacteraceae bacterium]|nr:sulfotransferase domain-containing protein [Solirubrobacteraceae bacterium]